MLVSPKKEQSYPIQLLSILCTATTALKALRLQIRNYRKITVGSLQAIV